MPIQILNSDITRVACDAIVYSADPRHSAGPDSLKPSDLTVTEVFSLPCRYVFHTVGPVWAGGKNGEAAVLKGCYEKALRKAKELNLHSIAFPLISSGAFGFPKDRVLRLAMDAISAFLLDGDTELLVSVCVPDRRVYTVPDELCLEDICYRGNQARAMEREDILLPQDAAFSGKPVLPPPALKSAAPAPKAAKKKAKRLAAETVDSDLICEQVCPPPNFDSYAAAAGLPDDLESWIERQDESFSLMLQKLIDKKGMDDVSCYKKANVSRKTYWKIVNDADYRPAKNTVIAFAIALKLNYEETQRLLRSVGFSLSESFVFDRIIEYYIDRGIYDVFEINAALYHFDQPLLGC